MATLVIGGILAALVVLAVFFLSGKRVMFAVKWDGPARSKCPKCGSPIELTERAPGESAFACGSCGESGRWTG